MQPEKIDRYQIISECGTGGMATVYKAFDPQHQREVALKVMAPEYLNDQEFRERFKREIGIHSSFKHEAVVPIYGYGQYQNQLYLVVGFMGGGSLEQKLSNGKPLPPDEVVALLKRITPALDAAHEKGIIHRDMKPSNILFDERGLAYICDFGIARSTEQPNLTSVYGSSMIGSPAYMSPEQVNGVTQLDYHCDLYSLGVMVYEMLTAQLPFYDSKPLKMAFEHVSEPIPDILVANPRLPHGCKAYIFKAMAKKPEDRFYSALEMADALAAIFQLAKPSAGGRHVAEAMPGEELSRSTPAPSKRPPGEQHVEKTMISSEEDEAAPAPPERPSEYRHVEKTMISSEEFEAGPAPAQPPPEERLGEKTMISSEEFEAAPAPTKQPVEVGPSDMTVVNLRLVKAASAPEEQPPEEQPPEEQQAEKTILSSNEGEAAPTPAKQPGEIGPSDKTVLNPRLAEAAADISPSPIPQAPSPQPAAIPSEAQEQAAPPPKSSAAPSFARQQTSLGDFFRRTFGFSPKVPSGHMPVVNTFTIPSSLRPLTGRLGLSTTIAMSRRTVILLVIVAFVLVFCIALAIGLAATYFIAQRAIANPHAPGYIWVVFHQCRFFNYL